jgi:hypothetical protein
MKIGLSRYPGDKNGVSEYQFFSVSRDYTSVFIQINHEIREHNAHLPSFLLLPILQSLIHLVNHFVGRRGLTNASMNCPLGSMRDTKIEWSTR